MRTGRLLFEASVVRAVLLCAVPLLLSWPALAQDQSRAIALEASAAPSTVQHGHTTTLKWSSDAKSCTISGEGQSIDVSPSGELVTPPITRTVTALFRCERGRRAIAETSVTISVDPSSLPDRPVATTVRAAAPRDAPPPAAPPDSWLGVPPPPFGLTETGSVVVERCGAYEGTPGDPVILRISTSEPCTISGAYLIVERSDLQRLTLTGHHIAVRDSRIHNANTGSMLWIAPGSTDVVIYRNEIDHNGVIPSREDRHGIGLGPNTTRVWILDNHIHHNSGDSIQFCHACINKGNGPGAVYISGNTMHDDEENALDFKEFRGPVIVTRNEMYGYRPSVSSNGDALRVNDEGRQGEIWIVANVFRDNALDINADRSRATSYIIDNNGRAGRGGTYTASGRGARRFYDLYEERYGVSIQP